jgi:hypothetical protein
MGDMIPTNVDDFIEDFLKNSLQIDILDYQKLEFGGEGYTIIYVSNLDETQVEVLQSVGFEQIKGDLWIYEGFEINPEDLKDTTAGYFENLQKEKWEELMSLRHKVDSQLYINSNKETMFRTTHNTPRIVLKWHGRLVFDESTLNDFINDINKLLREGKVKELFNSSLFINGIGCLRNVRIAHDSSKINQIDVANKYLEDIVGTYDLKHWFQFTSAQIRLIEDGIDFLNEEVVEHELFRGFTNSKT